VEGRTSVHNAIHGGGLSFRRDLLLDLSSGGATITGSGILTAQDFLSASWDSAYAGYLVTLISGTLDGGTITALLPVNAFQNNDDLIFTSQQLFDFDGISLTVSGTNLAESEPNANMCYVSACGGCTLNPSDMRVAEERLCKAQPA
jgi:hypothetical protein